MPTTRVASVTRLISGASRADRPGAGPAVRPSGENRSGGLRLRHPATAARRRLATPKSSALAVARAVIEPVLGPLETTVIVLIVAIFILMQREDLRDRFIRLFGCHRSASDDDGDGRCRSAPQPYFVSQLAVNTCFGLVIGVGLWLIGIPSAALWGVLAGLLRFVPYVGPLLAAVRH